MKEAAGKTEKASALSVRQAELLMAAVICICLLLHVNLGKLWVYILLFEMMFVNIIVPCVYAWMHKDDGKSQDKA